MPSVCLFIALVVENGPSGQWPDPLDAEVSKNTGRSWKASGKVPFDATGPNLSNNGKCCIVRSLEKQKGVMKAADHFHRHRSQYSSLGESHMLPVIV